MTEFISTDYSATVSPPRMAVSFLGEMHFAATALERDLDEPRLSSGGNRASERLALFDAPRALRVRVDEAGFGASGYLAGKLYSVTHTGP